MGERDGGRGWHATSSPARSIAGSPQSRARRSVRPRTHSGRAPPVDVRKRRLRAACRWCTPPTRERPGARDLDVGLRFFACSSCVHRDIWVHVHACIPGGGGGAAGRAVWLAPLISPPKVEVVGRCIDDSTPSVDTGRLPAGLQNLQRRPGALRGCRAPRRAASAGSQRAGGWWRPEEWPRCRESSAAALRFRRLCAPPSTILLR